MSNDHLANIQNLLILMGATNNPDALETVQRLIPLALDELERLEEQYRTDIAKHRE